MSRVPWHLFEERQPRAHLVAGAIEVAADGDELAAALNRKRLVRQQKPNGDYAATVARDAGGPRFISFSKMKPMPRGSPLALEPDRQAAI